MAYISCMLSNYLVFAHVIYIQPLANIYFVSILRLLWVSLEKHVEPFSNTILFLTGENGWRINKL